MNIVLLGALAPKHVSWLTPIWLLGLGGLAALLLLGVLWAVFTGLSRIPGLGELIENRRRFRWVSLAVSLVVFLGLAVWEGGHISTVFAQEGSEAGLQRLLSAGALAVPVMIAVWGAVAGLLSLASRRLMDEIEEAVTEGILLPVLVAVAVLAAIGVAGAFFLRSPEASWAIVKSLGRLPYVGERTIDTVIPASKDPDVLEGRREPPPHPVLVDFRGEELQRIAIRSSQDIAVARDKDVLMDSPESLQVLAGDEFEWRRRGLGNELFGRRPVKYLYVRNRGVEDARVTFTLSTEIPYPQTLVIPVFAGLVAVVFGVYLALRTIAPRISAIALATYKSETAQPIFLLAVILTGVFLVGSIVFPYFTFGEDIKMLKDAGLNVLKVASIIVAVWGASSTVSEEIEGKTALTVLSKPLTRRSFVIGKFLGINWTVALMYLVLGLIFLAVVSGKPIYDARELARDAPPWETCFLEVVGSVPPLVLSFLEAMVLATIAVAISTRLPMLANLTICFSLYALGHLTTAITSGTQNQFAIVKFFGQLVSVVVPALEAYDVHTAIDAGLRVPGAYVAMTGVYTATFAVIALLLALLLFEDRDVS